MHLWNKYFIILIFAFVVVFFPLQKIQGFQEARETFGRVQKYNGMLDCFRIILREEGAFGFFKGLAPSTLKVRRMQPLSLYSHRTSLHPGEWLGCSKLTSKPVEMLKGNLRWISIPPGEVKYHQLLHAKQTIINS